MVSQSDSIGAGRTMDQKGPLWRTIESEGLFQEALSKDSSLPDVHLEIFFLTYFCAYVRRYTLDSHQFQKQKGKIYPNRKGYLVFGILISADPLKTSQFYRTIMTLHRHSSVRVGSKTCLGRDKRTYLQTYCFSSTHNTRITLQICIPCSTCRLFDRSFFREE